MIISIVFIIVLLVLLVVQHVWHQSVLNDKRYEHNMSIDRIYDAMSNEWVKGNIASSVYLPVIEVVEKQRVYHDV